MKKIVYFLILSCILTNCLLASNKKEIYKSETLLIYKLSDHIYEHISYLDTESYGKVSCNGMIVSSNAEAVIFDTPTNDAASLELIEWTTKELNNKIIAIIPTHYHEDNLGGLNEFHKHGIPSYAYQKTIQITKEKNYPQPQHGFDKSFKLKVGNENIVAEFLGEGHTCDNIIGYFPAENIMFGGCLIKALGSGKGNLEEANPEDWPESVKKVKSKYPETKTIIPGHGESGGTELFDYTIKLFEQKN